MVLIRVLRSSGVSLHPVSKGVVHTLRGGVHAIVTICEVGDTEKSNRQDATLEYTSFLPIGFGVHLETVLTDNNTVTDIENNQLQFIINLVSSIYN